MRDEGYVLLYDDSGYRPPREAYESWRIAARADALSGEADKPQPAGVGPPKRRGLRRWLHRLRWKEL